MTKTITKFDREPYSNSLKDSQDFFHNNINKLTKYHYQKSKQYKNILDFFGYKNNKIYEIKKLPFIPVRLFKEMELKSIKEKDIYKILQSSGTSSSNPSKIILDKQNALNQTNVLNKIMGHYLGNKRKPMLFIDQNPKLFDRNNFNARVAAINGFSIFGKDHTFLLNEKAEIDYDVLNNFLNKYSSSDFLIFGFTSYIYQNLLINLDHNKIKKNFKNATILHGGGWKKLQKLNIRNSDFKKELLRNLKINKVNNYYGLIEQTGSIFIECNCGYFIPSVYSDIIIRDKDFNILPNDKKGFIQLLSLLPSSYPGHNILTEDIGEIIEKHKCNCKYVGKRFVIHGRVEEAEIRGCSDV